MNNNPKNNFYNINHIVNANSTEMVDGSQWVKWSLERLKQGAANASQSTRQEFSNPSDPTNISFRDAMAMNKPLNTNTNLGLFALPVSEQYRFLVQDQGMTPYEAEAFLGY